MSEEDINKTIDNLCCGLKPCNRLRNPLWRSLLWIVIVISYVISVALFVAPQMDNIERLSHHHFLYEIILSFATGITASIVTFMLSVPDSRGKEWLYSIPATLFCVHMVWMLVRFGVEGFGVVPSDWFGHCWIDMILMAGVPATLVLVLIKRGATVQPRLLALNAVLAVASFGWIGMRLICPFETIGKAYFVNFLPFLAVGIVVGLAAKKLFRW